MEQSLAGQIAEIWVLYIIGMVMIGARIFVRTKLVGYQNYEWDDYLIFGVAGMWTAAPAIGQVFVQVAQGRHTSDLTYEERKNMSPAEREEWTYGSQMFLFGLTGYFFILWTLKFNMLCFYSRIVRNLWTEKFVKPVMGLLAVSAVAIIFTLALTCRPFQDLWQVWPDPGGHCVPQNLVFFVVILVFNLLTDICIMLIPIPVLVGVQLPRWKKVGLYVLFTLGFLCMFFAILRFVLVFKLNQRGVSALWSMREDCVGIFVGQAPIITPLLQRKFWEQTGYATSKTGNSGHRDPYHRYPSASHELASTAQVISGKPSDPYSMTILETRSDSQEEIITKDKHHSLQPHNGILVQKSIDVEGSVGTYKSPNSKDPRW